MEPSGLFFIIRMSFSARVPLPEHLLQSLSTAEHKLREKSKIICQLDILGSPGSRNGSIKFSSYLA
jgi:hypothetical protein